MKTFTDEQILEGNKLIAEFMGGEVINNIFICKESTKTHKVVEMTYRNNEENILFTGSYEECITWKDEDGLGYKVLKLSEEEIEKYNKFSTSC